MIDPDRLICYCNDKSVADIVNFIKKIILKELKS